MPPVPPPVVPVVLVVWVPPGTPAPPELAPPAGTVTSEDEPDEEPASEFPDDADEEPELSVLVVEVLVVFVEVVLGVALPVGTVSVGAPAVLAVGEPPPPQAEMPTATAAPAKRAASELAMRARRDVTAWISGPEGIHPASAMGAVVQILLSELVAPIAEAEVLDGPWQLGRGRSQGQQHGHRFHGLSGFPVHVGAAGLGLDDDFTLGRGCPQTIFLIEPHHFDATSGP